MPTATNAPSAWRFSFVSFCRVRNSITCASTLPGLSSGENLNIDGNAPRSLMPSSTMGIINFFPPQGVIQFQLNLAIRGSRDDGENTICLVNGFPCRTRHDSRSVRRRKEKASSLGDMDVDSVCGRKCLQTPYHDLALFIGAITQEDLECHTADIIYPSTYTGHIPLQLLIAVDDGPYGRARPQSMSFRTK